MNVVSGKTSKKSLPATFARTPEEKKGLPIVPEAAALPAMVVDENLVKSRILTFHGIQMMLSSDLAALYDVEVKHLHRQVKRNQTRFPPDFVVHLSPDELKGLRCQNVTSNRRDPSSSRRLYKGFEEVSRLVHSFNVRETGNTPPAPLFAFLARWCGFRPRTSAFLPPEWRALHLIGSA